MNERVKSRPSRCHRPCLLLVFGPAQLLFVLDACSGSAPTAAGTDAGLDAGAGMGSDAGDAAGTGGDGGVCPGRSDLLAAAPMCNTLANSAALVPFTPQTGAPPAATGGIIRDGIYEATRAEGFGTAPAAGRHITVAILEGATLWLWNGEVLDAAGTQATSSFRVNAAVTIAGTVVTFQTTCMSGPSSPLPAALNFSVAGDDLLLFQDGPNAAATTYTRRGCP